MLGIQGLKRPLVCFSVSISVWVSLCFFPHRDTRLIIPNQVYGRGRLVCLHVC